VTDRSARSTDAERHFWRTFWQRPRTHGEPIHERKVSFIELFYDLVYVVLVSQAAHSLAHHVSWEAFGQFVVVFSLIWIAWFNGVQYHELHAREDGRSRVMLFLQMLLIAPLASFTGDAAGEDGAKFALTYALLTAVFVWLWWSVQRIDEPEYRRTTTTYLVTMVALGGAMAASAFVAESVRLEVWAALVVVWILGTLAMRRRSLESSVESSTASEAIVERFGLFVIIVLGEVVVGVVNGLAETPDNVEYIITALLGLLVGFGLWWMYFDFVGERSPAHERAYGRWTLGHLPLKLSIAAIGGCMVNVLEHATDDRVPATTAWVMATAFSITMLSLTVLYRSLQSAIDHPNLYRKLVAGTLVAIPLALGIAAWQPSPPVMLAAYSLLLLNLWWTSVATWLRSDAPMQGWPPQQES
jgi:low temperature requirement protein LtrA